MKTKSLLALLLTAPVVLAADEIPANESAWDFGGDFRLRGEYTDNFPSGHKEKDNSNYLRLRTHIFGKYTQGRFEGFLQLGNEFRYYTRDAEKGKQRFPDVTFVDQLYVKGSDLFDGLLDVKIGRQNMKFGNSRIVSDGTGGDSSRSAYFDALRLTFDFGDKRTLDAFAIYTARHDWLPTAGHTHDARSKNKKSYDYDTTGYNHTEYGAGLYYSDKSYAPLPWEAYYVWKTEDGNHSDVIQKGDTFTTHTFGTRLIPQFSKTLSGELEAAVQFGDDSHLAFLAHAGLTYAPEWQYKPKFTVATTYLSGDKDGDRGQHAWHAVFNRQTHFGDIPSAMFDKNAFTNFLYPHLAVQLSPSEYTKLNLQAGPMFAPVAEEKGAGGDYGHFRGFFAQVKYGIQLGKLLSESESLSSLNLNFVGEAMSKGSDWFPEQDGTAYFGRVEFTYTF